MSVLTTSGSDDLDHDGTSIGCSTRMANPYQSPSDKTLETEETPDTQQVPVGELSDESQGNLRLTSKIVKVASVVSGLMSLACVLQIWFTYRLYVYLYGWSGVRIWICLRIVYAPCWFLLAWMMWKYARSLDAMAEKGLDEADAVIEQQAKMWLAVGLLIFVMLVAFAIFTSSGIARQIPR